MILGIVDMDVSIWKYSVQDERFPPPVPPGVEMCVDNRIMQDSI